MSILFRKGHAAPVRLDETTFGSEALLQEYIYQNPETVPLYEIDKNVQLLVVAREFPTNSGPIDALAIDSEGELYIVETKLFKNPDKRVVIAQALDYGAALWKNVGNFSDFLTILDQRAQKTWEKSLSQKLGEYFSLDEVATARLLEIARENLASGILRFVVLMDRVDERLKDLVLYVNQNSQFDVYAVELECYRYEDNEIVIPRVYGTEVKKDLGVRGPGSSRRKWTEQETQEDARKNLLAREYDAFMKLYDFARNHADRVTLGTGVTQGSFGPVYEDVCPRSVFTLRTNGMFSWNWRWLGRSEREVVFRSLLLESMREQFDLSDADMNSYLQYEPDKWVPRVDTVIEGLSRAIRAYRSQA
ncbi:MAG: hypothetical protein ACREMD_11480 [Gemmatimonadota bacterium]